MDEMQKETDDLRLTISGAQGQIQVSLCTMAKGRPVAHTIMLSLSGQP
jgi:predicted KAP-like P-loop ATPase